MTPLTPSQRETLRTALLIALADGPGSGLPLSTLHFTARQAGFSRTAEHEVERDLDYLTDKGLSAVDHSAISAGLKRWRLTAAGRDYLESEGHI